MLQPDDIFKLSVCVAGIDLSLTCPAITIINPNPTPSTIVPFKDCQSYYLISKQKYTLSNQNITGAAGGHWDSPEDRYETIAEWVISVLQKHNVKSVGIEGYAFSKQTNTLTQLAENQGLLKYFLYKNNIPYNIFTPSNIKKFATSKGNADKAAMKDAFYQDNPDYDIMDMFNKKPTDKVISPISDIIDSYYIALSERIANIAENADYTKGRKKTNDKKNK